MNPPIEIERRSETHIKEEIAKLQEMKPHVLTESVFGDNHHDAIDAQIKVLEENLDDNKIYELWGDTEADDFADNVLDAAIWAFNWREILIEDTPSADWESLDTRTKG